MFQSIVMPNFFYGLSVYGASSSDLNNVEHFLDKCYERRYISRKLNIRELLERSDCRTFRKSLGTNSSLVKIPARSDFPTFVSATWIRESISCHSATEKQSDFNKPRTFISHDLSSLGFSDLAEVRAIFPRCEIDPTIL